LRRSAPSVQASAPGGFLPGASPFPTIPATAGSEERQDIRRPDDWMVRIAAVPGPVSDRSSWEYQMPVTQPATRNTGLAQTGVQMAE